MVSTDRQKHLFLWYRPRDDRPKEISLSAPRFRFLTFLLVSVVVVLIIGGIFYAGLLRRALEGIRLKQENQRLRAEVARIQLLQEDLGELQRFGRQVQRSLTEGTDLGRILEANEAAKDDVPPMVESDQSWLPVYENTLSIADSSDFPDVLLNLENNLYDIPKRWPVEGFITRGFEKGTIDPSHSHMGVDIAAPRGTPVRATAAGTVIVADWTPRLGHRIIIDHGGTAFSVYGHNEIILVHPHQKVNSGSVISLSGNSGISTAPHLHFEIWAQGQAIDPLLLLDEKKQVVDSPG